VVPPGPPAEVAVPDALGEPVHPQRQELLLQRAAPLAAAGIGADAEGACRARCQRAGEDDLLAVLVDALLRGPAQEASHLDAVDVRAGVGLADHLQQPGLGLPFAAHEHDLHSDLLGRGPLLGGEQARRRAAEGGGRHQRQEEGRGSRERRGATDEQERAERGHGGRRRSRRGRAGEGTVARPQLQLQLDGAELVVERSAQSVAAGGGGECESASSHGCALCLTEPRVCKRSDGAVN